MKMLEYFMSCYFNMGFDYEDLDFLIDNFKTTETKDYFKNFIIELSSIMRSNDYKKASEYIDKYGDRTFSLNCTKIFIKYLYDRLNDIPTDVKAIDFYKIK